MAKRCAFSCVSIGGGSNFRPDLSFKRGEASGARLRSGRRDVSGGSRARGLGTFGVEVRPVQIKEWSVRWATGHPHAMYAPAFLNGEACNAWSLSAAVFSQGREQASFSLKGGGYNRGGTLTSVTFYFLYV